MTGTAPDAAATDWFGERVAPEGAKRRSVRGIVVSALGRGTGQAINLAALLVLARLLTPAEFGLVAMVTAVVGIGALFQDLGLSGATLRLRRITHAQASNLFWINAAAGALAALAIVASSPLLEAFYREPQVRPIAAAMSLGLVCGGLGAQHTALLRRMMKFTRLARITTLGALASAVAAVVAALEGAGPWALVIGSLSGSLIATVLAWAACDWRPGWPRRGVGTREAIRFGLHMLGFGVLGFLAKNIHTMLVGRYWGAAPAGLYGRAFAVATRVNGAILGPLGVVVPAVMGGMAGDSERFRRYYYRGCALTLMAVMPGVFVCLALPRELLAVVLGDQWLDAARPLQWLAIGALPQVLAHTTGWVYLSAGDSRAMLLWGVIGWGAMIAAAFVGVGFGIEGLALASSATSILLLWPCLRFAFSRTTLRIDDLFRALAGPLVAGATAAAVVALALHLAPPASALVRLVAGSLGFVALYAVLAVSVFGQWALVVDVVAQLRDDRTGARGTTVADARG